MTPDQVHRFNDKGIVRLDGFHARGVAPVRQRVLDELRRLTGGKGLPRAVQGLPVFQQIGKLSSLVKVPGAHGALVTPALVACIGQLAGRAVPVPQPLQLLLSPPQQGAWRLEGLNWHVDVVADPPGRVPGIQAFFLIDDVAPQGGATLALAGSHRATAQRGAAAGARGRRRRDVRARGRRLPDGHAPLAHAVDQCHPPDAPDGDDALPVRPLRAPQRQPPRAFRTSSAVAGAFIASGSPPACATASRSAS